MWAQSYHVSNMVDDRLFLSLSTHFCPHCSVFLHQQKGSVIIPLCVLPRSSKQTERVTGNSLTWQNRYDSLSGSEETAGATQAWGMFQQAALSSANCQDMLRHRMDLCRQNAEWFFFMTYFVWGLILIDFGLTLKDERCLALCHCLQNTRQVVFEKNQ